MINLAPNLASSDNVCAGASLTVIEANNPSIFCCISADGGTVRLTA
jgi:hypothetical protein